MPKFEWFVERDELPECAECGTDKDVDYEYDGDCWCKGCLVSKLCEDGEVMFIGGIW